MRLHEITDKDDDLEDDDARYEREQQLKHDVEEVLVKLGFDRDDIEKVWVDDDEVEAQIATGTDGIPLTLLEKLRKSNMAAGDYYIAGHGTIYIALRFKVSKDIGS